MRDCNSGNQVRKLYFDIRAIYALQEREDMFETYSIQLPGAKYPCSKDYQTLPANAEKWQRLLKNAHGKSATCLCLGNGQKALNIRHLKALKRYVLARSANSGHEHATDCRFFSEAEYRTGLGSYVEGVVQEGNEDDVSVRLSQAIQLRKKNDDADPKVDLPFDSRKPGRTQRAMSLLGLLHLLWTRSGLNTWFPKMEGKRDDSILQWLLERTAENIKTHRMTLDRVLLSPAKHGSRNREVLDRAKTHQYRLIAVGVLQPFSGGVDDTLDDLQSLPLMSSAGIPTMWLKGKPWADARLSFAHELNAWKSGAKTVAIAFLSLRDKSRYYDVLEVALMRVSEMLIPLDSGLEGKVEAMLREQKRKFSKPLRFDADDKTIPDFWLNDLDDEFPMEVFGMNTTEYVLRKNAKISHYQTEYAQRLGWWYWDACNNSDVTSIPPLPPATR
ncbi:DUF1173 domain-containing protein [Pseudomonas jessenii]|uniref:DUF1173 domain-containing protein n=1 Tax=Pseudomonas jessenii TaxID=77298 RepID=A0A5C4L107_PSEJE|nr:DUF1173 family protein [Pseudomonas jessenii]TNB98531.1 DUF1173 domain-containing protein [Pseudomonas jessenii]